MFLFEISPSDRADRQRLQSTLQDFKSQLNTAVHPRPDEEASGNRIITDPMPYKEASGNRIITDRELDIRIQSYLTRKFGSGSLNISYFSANDMSGTPCEYITYTCSKWSSTQGVLWLHKSATETPYACVWFKHDGTVNNHTPVLNENIIDKFMDQFFGATPDTHLLSTETTPYIDQFTDIRPLSDFVTHLVHDMYRLKNYPNFKQIIKQYIDGKVDKQLSQLDADVDDTPGHLMTAVGRLVNICSKLADKT